MPLQDFQNINLRAVEPEDAEFMWNCDNDQDIWLDACADAPLSKENLRNYALTYDADPFRASQLRLIIESEGTRCGILDLYEISARHRTALVGIYILKNMRGRHIGQHALDSVAKYAASMLNLRALAARVPEINSNACKLFKSAGYEKCAMIPGWLLCEGNPHNMLIYLNKLDVDKPSKHDFY